MRKLFVLAFVLSASVASSEPLRASPTWLRLYLPIRPQLVPGAGGGSSGTPSALTFLSLNVAQTPDTYYFSTDSLGNSLIIGEAGDAAFDFAHPQQTDPTLFVQSHNQSTTEWISLFHTGTAGVIANGTGNGTVFRDQATDQMRMGGGAIMVSSSTSVGWSSSGTVATGNPDVSLRRYSAGVIKQVAGTTTSIGALLGGGGAVASADPLPVPTGNVFHVTGTTSFTNITTTNMVTGACFTIIFDGILTATDGGNLKLSATMVTTADDTLTLCYDGTNYFEVARAVN